METVKTIAAVVAILLVLAGLATSNFWLTPFLHDRYLEKYVDVLAAIKLPNGVEKTGSLSKVGQQSGNSDHCDYLAAVMLKTALPKEEVEAYFQNAYRGTSEIRFIWGDEMREYASEDNRISGIHTLRDWLSSRPDGEQTNLIVYLFDVGATTSWDYRCM